MKGSNILESWRIFRYRYEFLELLFKIALDKLSYTCILTNSIFVTIFLYSVGTGNHNVNIIE